MRPKSSFKGIYFLILGFALLFSAGTSAFTDHKSNDIAGSTVNYTVTDQPATLQTINTLDHNLLEIDFVLINPSDVLQNTDGNYFSLAPSINLAKGIYDNAYLRTKRIESKRFATGTSRKTPEVSKLLRS
jgi:hypothetical protein